MCKDGCFRFFRILKNTLFFTGFFRIAVILSLLACISCTAYHVAPRETQTMGASNESREKQAALPHQCQPIVEGLYVVQAGAFKMLSYAQNLRNALDKKGYSSYITVSGSSEDARIFRVLVGRFVERKQAQSLADEIRKKENIEVIVAVKPPREKYVVQAGCYANMEDARANRKKLADYGYNPYITQSISGSDRLYNVLLGEYLDRMEAEKACREIREKTNIPAFVNTL